MKEELMPTACHPSRWWDWWMSEDVKVMQKNVGYKHEPFVSDDRIQKSCFLITWYAEIKNVLIKEDDEI